MNKDTEKYRTKIGGMSCSFCSQSIKKAYNRTKGVKNANVTISHEEALIECDSSEISSQEPEKMLLALVIR